MISRSTAAARRPQYHSASIHEEKDSIEEILEPYYSNRISQSHAERRTVTRHAYEHFGLPPNPPRPGLFDQ